MDSLAAPEISGTYLITASLVSNPSVKDTVNLNVQVPRLVYFGDLIYLPNSDKPFTFFQSDIGIANHPENDYCTPAMGDSLFLAIQDFYDRSASTQGGVPLKLSLNDMSLPWGGAFDYKGNWNVNSEHTFHRIGLAVDINNTGLKVSDPSNPKLTHLTRIGEHLKTSVEKFGGAIYSEPTIHFGFFHHN